MVLNLKEMNETLRFLKVFGVMLMTVSALTSIGLYVLTFVDENDLKANGILNNLTFEGNPIFFLETNHDRRRGNEILTRRQACSVESAAKTNPNRTVVVFYVSPKKSNCEKDVFTFNCILRNYKNVQFTYLDLNGLIIESVPNNFVKKILLKSREYLTTHLSDFLRFLVLYKYGGIYFDTDVLILKSFDDISDNFIGFESDFSIGSAVLGFEKYGTGHKYAEWCLNDYINNYQAELREGNGPNLLERLASYVCQDLPVVPSQVCEKLKLYDRDYFYPVSWRDWQEYFHENLTESQFEKLKKSHAVHLWNFHSGRYKLSLSSNSAYVRLAKEFCPKVIEYIGDAMF